MAYKDQKEFLETINISSNIKDNKNTIIGKFDLKDILFILIAGVVGIGVLSVLLVVFSIKNMFLILIILALFEVPIITIGFLKLHDIPVIDYIKMKNKSDNKSYRKQILKKEKSKPDKYILTFCLGELREYQINKIKQVLNDLYGIMPYKNVELKIIFKIIYITIEVEDLSEVNYDKLFDCMRINKEIKYISNEDIKNFETYIGSLKFANKKYGKKQNKAIIELKSKLNKLKKTEELKDKYDYLTNRIIDAKATEWIKVYKFLLYKSPFDINIFNELKEFCNITSHMTIEKEQHEVNKVQNNFNYVNTFIDIIGSIEEVNDNSVKVKDILDKNHILSKEINEEKVKDSLLFLMENKY